MKSIKPIVEQLSKLNVQGWSNRGLNHCDTKYDGYLYPITDKESDYTGKCLGIEEVAYILLFCSRYFIKEDNSIELW